MRRRRIRHRADTNQKEIIAFLKSVHASVDVIGDPVDLLVGFRGENYLMEVKPRAEAKLTEQQEEFFWSWRGQVARVQSVYDCKIVLGLVRT